MTAPLRIAVGAPDLRLASATPIPAVVVRPCYTAMGIGAGIFHCRSNCHVSFCTRVVIFVINYPYFCRIPSVPLHYRENDPKPILANYLLMGRYRSSQILLCSQFPGD